MTDRLEDLAARLIAAARAAGAGAADAMAVEGESLGVDLHQGKLDQADRAEGIDLGLRVLVGPRQACVSSSDSRPETLAAMAERAVAMAREAPEDPWCGLADPSELARGWDLAALGLDAGGPGPDPAALEALAARATGAAREVSGVTQVESAGAQWRRVRVHMAASNGFSGGYSRAVHSLYVTAIAGEGLGMERDHAGESRVLAAEMPSPESIGQLAGARAIAMLGASKPPTGAYPVLFDERIAASLIGHLTSAINGSAIARGASWLKDALGTDVLPKGFDLTEEPLRPRGLASQPFDGEGLPVATRVMVCDGVLAGWTLDLATARQLGLKSTGNAGRGTGAPPSPSLTNLRLSPGRHSRAELLREMGTGLLVTDFIGMSINPTTGDYSRGASGFWVEGGEIIRPVNECTVAGNLRDMLRTLVAANDGREHVSRVVPSLLVEGLTIAGG